MEMGSEPIQTAHMTRPIQKSLPKQPSQSDNTDMKDLRGWKFREWPMVQCPPRFRWLWDLSYVLHGFCRPLLWVPPKGHVRRTQLQALRMIRKKRLHRQVRTMLRWSRRHRKPFFQQLWEDMKQEFAKMVADELVACHQFHKRLNG